MKSRNTTANNIYGYKYKYFAFIFNEKKINSLLIFLCLCIVYTLFTFYSSNYLMTEEVYYRSFSSQLPVYSIDEMLESREKFWWVAYTMQIVVVFFKVLFATLCIFVGVVLSDIKFSFKDLFRSIIIAETIFVIAQLIFLLNLYFHLMELTFETTANYFPLSLLSFWGTENVVPWLHYPLQTLNLFEVFYILFISWLLSKQWKPNFVESLNIVLPSYGTGLLLWLVLVTFLTLQIS